MTISANDAHPFPIYACRFRAIFPILDADGDLVTAVATPDSELSQDSGTFADATNEMTEIATGSGVYFLDLISTEMDTTSTTIIAKTATAGAKTTVIALNPRRYPVIRAATAQAGAATTITLDAGASAVDDFYVGCYVRISNDSPVGALGQARLITDYVGSTKVATVATWGTNPSVASTFEILAPPDAQGVLHAGTVSPDPAVAGQPKVTTQAIATDAITAASIAIGAIAADAFAAGAIDNAAFNVTETLTANPATGGIVAGSFGAGAIDAAAIATDAIGSLEFSQAAADKVWASATRTLTAFSTALAVSVWDVLETAILTASSIGLKVKNNLDALVTSRATPAQVRTEVVGALDTDTYASPGQAAPASTATLVSKIGYLYKAFRNRKTQTATLWSLLADDEATVDQKATVSDDATTAIKQEIVSGP